MVVLCIKIFKIKRDIKKVKARWEEQGKYIKGNFEEQPPMDVNVITHPFQDLLYGLVVLC